MILKRASVPLLLVLGIFVLRAEEKPRPYVRMEANKDGSRMLQTAWRKLEPPKDSGKPVVWLIGVCHVGAKSYYQKTQEKLDSAELVLFEGIGFDGKKEKEKKTAESKVSKLQTTLAQSLGLVFQLDAIEYERDHFRNSDLGVAELQAKLAGASPKGKSASKENDPQLRAFMKMLEGDSFALTLVQGILKLFQGNPQFQAMARLVIIETIAASEGDVSKLAAASSPAMRRVFKTLIDDRNAVVLKDLRKNMRGKEVPSDIAVFYGAGHMKDLEERLCKKLAYSPAEETWVTVFSVNPKKAGLSAFETAMVSRMIKSQLAKMQQAGVAPKKKNR